MMMCGLHILQLDSSDFQESLRWFGAKKKKWKRGEGNEKSEGKMKEKYGRLGVDEFH